MNAAPLPAPPSITVKDAQEHLAELGLSKRVFAVTPCSGGLSNHNYRVQLADGSLVLLRVYRWAHDEPEPVRRIKEPWVHRLLATAGVPVPRILASSDRCAVVEWVNGIKLRQIALTETPQRLAVAWRETGEALRLAHGSNPFGDTSGEIVGNQIRPFDLSWGAWNAREIRRHTARLRQLDAILPADESRIERICGRLPELLGAPAPVLAHNDAHPANVLVASREGAWRLAAWIDWEYAWVADPDWDLARFAFFGRAQVGDVPASFWVGYGRQPDPVRSPIYELHMVAWLAGMRPVLRAPAAPELLAREVLRDLGWLLDKIETA